jgi:hypothetical protein
MRGGALPTPTKSCDDDGCIQVEQKRLRTKFGNQDSWLLAHIGNYSEDQKT